MSKVYVMDHPLIQHKVGIIRREEVGSKDFRQMISEIAMLMCYESTRNLKLQDVKIKTPICETTVKELILCCSEGTKFAGLIDEMVEIEVEGTHAYQEVLRKLGRPSPHIDPSLEHILITGMFHTFFELIIHEMPLKDAENYVREMRAFYTAGWMKIMGQ